MLALEEGEEVLCILQTANNVLLLAARGGRCASIGYNGVDGQAGSSGTNSVRKESSQVRKGGTGGQPGEYNSEGGYYMEERERVGLIRVVPG